MTEHHAECTRLWLLNDFKHHARPSDPEQCDYCQAFRACEQRILDAAREAVAAVPPIDQRVDDNGLISLVYDKGEILAAIDALRGSGNPHTPPSAEKGEQA